MILFNRAAADLSFVGRGAILALFNRVLLLPEIQAWQYRPRNLSGCVGFWRLGSNGTATQPDFSGNGNSGTVTGATVAEDPPLGKWRRRAHVYVPWAAAVGAPPIRWFPRRTRFS
jgi:hypothetical protein